MTLQFSLIGYPGLFAVCWSKFSGTSALTFFTGITVTFTKCISLSPSVSHEHKETQYSQNFGRHESGQTQIYRCWLPPAGYFEYCSIVVFAFMRHCNPQQHFIRFLFIYLIEFFGGKAACRFDLCLKVYRVGWN